MSQRRQVDCPHCGQKIGLDVREESFGHKLEVTCPSCAKTFQTIISPEQQETENTEARRTEAFGEAFGFALYNAITTDPGIMEVVEKMHAEGYEIALCLSANLGIGKTRNARGEMHEPTPLVKNGEVVPDAFNEADQHLMKDLRIKF